MRSRYTAYALLKTRYLLETWHSITRPVSLVLDKKQKWLGLKIKGCEQGLAEDCKGTVEFVARYKVEGRAHRLHEVSRFIKLDGAWVYVDGELKST
jgi:SEC-C motif-containing protein